MVCLKANMMKIASILLVVLCFSTGLSAQTPAELTKGSVSFESTQNTYVKFENTDAIKEGDTLYIERNKQLVPALFVKSKSSISCVCGTIGPDLLPLNSAVYLKPVAVPRKEEIMVEVEKPKTTESVNEAAIKAAMQRHKEDSTKQNFNGRISLSSFVENSSNYPSSIRNRYNLSLNVNHIHDTGFSAETNLIYTDSYVPSYRKPLPGKVITDPNGIKADSIAYTDTLISARKIQSNFYVYSLSLTYDLSKTASITVGRKLNLNLANIGAVDGVQFNKVMGKYTLGAIVGSRPNYPDMLYNPNLMEAGAFVSHNLFGKHGSMQTSFAFFNQTNNLTTDRRFIYFQHSNTLAKNLSFFCSFEADLYRVDNVKDSAMVRDGAGAVLKNIAGTDSMAYWSNRTPKNALDLTSAYVSLRYTPFRNLSLGLSYDVRKNVYYYQTFYKNKMDSIYDRETRQGFRFQFSYRPFRFLNWGGTAGYRIKGKSDSIAAINGYTYLTYSNLPLIDAALSINATLMKTNYMNGTIYGATLSRDFFGNKVYLELGYRFADSQFKRSVSTLHQDIYDASLSYMISKQWIISGDFEHSVEDDNRINTLFVNLTRRF